MYIHTYIHTYTYMYIYMYSSPTHTHTHTHTHAHTHTLYSPTNTHTPCARSARFVLLGAQEHGTQMDLPLEFLSTCARRWTRERERERGRLRQFL